MRPTAPPRILFVAESFHPVFGGGERHLREVAAGLVAAGWTSTVVTRRTERTWPARETIDGIDVRRVPPAGPGRRGKYAMLPWAAASVARLARRHDVVVVRGTRVLGVPGVLAARWAGAAVVLQPEVNGELSGEAFTWGRAWAEGWRGRLVRAVLAARRPVLRDADAFVAMSRCIRAEMLAAGAEPGRVFVLPHGVDTVRFRPATRDERAAARAALGLPEPALGVGYTGRLLRGKGLETLLEVFAGLAGRHPTAHLVLVGSGAGQSLSVEDSLRQRALAPDLAGRVHFTGRLDDVAGALRGLDVFAFPSTFEALGLSLIEAAATGLACVGSRTGGIPDVLDPDAGLLVAPGDARQLAEALDRLLGDAALRERLGGTARRVAVARFDRSDSLRRYRAVFGELTRRRSSAWRPARAPRGGAASRRSPATRA